MPTRKSELGDRLEKGVAVTWGEGFGIAAGFAVISGPGGSKGDEFNSVNLLKGIHASVPAMQAITDGSTSFLSTMRETRSVGIGPSTLFPSRHKYRNEALRLGADGLGGGGIESGAGGEWIGNFDGGCGITIVVWQWGHGAE